MKITFSEQVEPKNGAVIVGVHDNRKFSASARQIDRITKGVLRRAVRNSKFSGKQGEILSLIAPTGLSVSRVILVGLGKRLSELDSQNLGGSVAAYLHEAGEKTGALLIDCLLYTSPSPRDRG
mgnify:CR=1 FL=1